MGLPGTTAGGDAPSVLEDPTGRRARWLRRAGRLVFVVFLAWLVAIVLGGLGLLPVAGIPFAHVLQPAKGLPPLVTIPTPRQPAAAVLRPALTAKALAARAAKARRQAAPGRSAAAPGQGGTPRGRSGAAPGRTKTTTTHGRSTPPPGQTTTVTHGRSTTAPGRTTTRP
jgi:hypothetical protein